MPCNQQLLNQAQSDLNELAARLEEAKLDTAAMTGVLRLFAVELNAALDEADLALSPFQDAIIRCAQSTEEEIRILGVRAEEDLRAAAEGAEHWRRPKQGSDLEQLQNEVVQVIDGVVIDAESLIELLVDAHADDSP